MYFSSKLSFSDFNTKNNKNLQHKTSQTTLLAFTLSKNSLQIRRHSLTRIKITVKLATRRDLLTQNGQTKATLKTPFIREQKTINQIGITTDDDNRQEVEVCVRKRSIFFISVQGYFVLAMRKTLHVPWACDFVSVNQCQFSSNNGIEHIQRKLSTYILNRNYQRH